MRGLRKKAPDWPEVFDLFLADRAPTCRPRTLAFYRQTWGYWAKFSGGDAPSRELCQAFLLHLGKTYNPNGALSVWRGVRAVLNFAHKEGHSPFDPAAVTPPRERKGQKEPLTAAECRAVLAACLNPRDKALVSLLLDTGLRAQEVCSVRAEDLNWEQREVYVWNGKGGKPRTVPFSATTAKALKRWAQVREPESPWFFHNVDNSYGTQLHPVYLTRCLSRIGQRAGVTPLGPHRLRHTFGRLYVAGGGDSAHLQRLMGHETLSMTQNLHLNR
ncbi:tyrosine-type recombinase/integrase [Deinococcus planocerae]|uniref:tyrosine-type recombinase/integrase n=1 Tax=Deinococcus planocerae TaxID=1737569 RepID=UPI000C7F1072|nr:site-specific integrase [Deinococcus planocerae]